ncbi:hypothetical protein [Vibrio cholerae]|uniref:hypothetical protein n=1 Tax=Vibrio cholerae TaxID=666 RepID=UPI002271F8EB|nr:hypothetical protein [Vibrio cholerae]
MSCNGDPFEPIPQAKFSERHWHSLPMDIASSGVLPVGGQILWQDQQFFGDKPPS